VYICWAMPVELSYEALALRAGPTPGWLSDSGAAPARVTQALRRGLNSPLAQRWHSVVPR